MLTKDQLLKINNNSSACLKYLDALNIQLSKYNINTSLRICHFLAQIIYESGYFKYDVENLNYSASALQSVFKKYFPTEDLANKYARKPMLIANRVYANRLGNSDEQSGDGWRYRGRGVLQLTGKSNYLKCGNALNIDLITNPDLICQDPMISILVACWFWDINNLNTLADKDDIKMITKRINGGYNGLENRINILNCAKNTLIK